MDSVTLFDRASLSAADWFTGALGLATLYTTLTWFYNLHFHPLSRVPGPFLARTTNLWYAYHWVRGKYPMAVKEAMKQYGDVVRVAPGEVAFITPRAASDIYASQTHHMEDFPKTDMFDLGGGDGGLTWEMDPRKHRQSTKEIAAAFSMKSIRAKEPTMHKYIDAFVQKMRDIGQSKEGIDLTKFADWLTLDISADLSYSREMGQLEQLKDAPFLKALWGLNPFITMNFVLKRFPGLSAVKFLFISPSTLLSELHARKLNRKEMESRIARRGTTQHLDHFEQLLAADAPEPTKAERLHYEVISAQLLIAGYEPIASQMVCTIMFSLQEPGTYNLLVQEIRSAFTRYGDITAEALAPLPYLNAALMETLRLTVLGGGGLPRYSPGATVDGLYIPKGYTVQYSHLGFSRDPRYFHDGERFRPQRWLPHDHPQWDPAFQNDARDDFFPFSQGPRSCIGKELAWRLTRLILGKVLWSYDVEKHESQRDVVFDRDFKMYGMWEKPSFRVRLRPVDRKD